MVHTHSHACNCSSERKRLDLSNRHSEKRRNGVLNWEKRVEQLTEDLKTMNEQLCQEIVGAQVGPENVLRESEERYRQFFNVSPAPTIIHRHNVILLANDASARVASSTHTAW